MLVPLLIGPCAKFDLNLFPQCNPLELHDKKQWFAVDSTPMYFTVGVRRGWNSCAPHSFGLVSTATATGRFFARDNENDPKGKAIGFTTATFPHLKKDANGVVHCVSSRPEYKLYLKNYTSTAGLPRLHGLWWDSFCRRRWTRQHTLCVVWGPALMTSSALGSEAKRRTNRLCALRQGCVERATMKSG